VSLRRQTVTSLADDYTLQVYIKHRSTPTLINGEDIEDATRPCIFSKQEGVVATHLKHQQHQLEQTAPVRPARRWTTLAYFAILYFATCGMPADQQRHFFSLLPEMFGQRG
jgi:hypothetical protein